MTAPEFARLLKRSDELASWILAFVPEGGGGTDLRVLPDWLRGQLAASGVAADNLITALPTFFSKGDWAVNHFHILSAALPADLASRLAPGPELAVCATHSAEFNGACVRVPDSRAAYVLVLPIGGMMLASYAGTLLSLNCCSDQLSDSLRRAGHRRLRFHESFSQRLFRTSIGRFLRRRAVTQYGQMRASIEFAMLLERYFELGVVDPPDIVRRFLPVPTFGTPARAIYPLEAGEWLQFFAMDFLILHECAHFLDDVAREPSSMDAEFEADRWALSTGLQMAADDSGRAACLVGAVAFLYIAHCIDSLGGDYAASHPEANARIQRLWSVAALHAPDSHAPWLRMAQTFYDACQKEWERSAWFREHRRSVPSTLETLLTVCIEEHRPQLLQDQLPRWFLFGIPERLCKAIATTRVALEAQLVTDPEPPHIREKLDLLKWVYSTARSSSSSTLADRLDAAYSSEIARVRVEGQTNAV